MDGGTYNTIYTSIIDLYNFLYEYAEFCVDNHMT